MKFSIRSEREKGKTTEVLSVDLAKAYESIPVSLLWKILKITNINENPINIIKTLSATIYIN